MQTPHFTPIQVLNHLTAGNLDSFQYQNFEYGYEIETDGVYAKHPASSTLYLCSGEEGDEITSETLWVPFTDN